MRICIIFAKGFELFAFSDFVTLPTKLAGYANQEQKGRLFVTLPMKLATHLFAGYADQEQKGRWQAS
jgi:hypothetical protein